jgi:hypothetical protein
VTRSAVARWPAISAAASLRRAPRLTARLASLRGRGKPTLGIELLLGSAERENVAALGAGDLLVAHRDSFVDMRG